MVPSYNVLRSVNRLALIDVIQKVLFTFLTSADTRLCTLFWKRDDVEDVHAMILWETLHTSHDFHIITRFGMHYHLD